MRKKKNALHVVPLTCIYNLIAHSVLANPHHSCLPPPTVSASASGATATALFTVSAATPASGVAVAGASVADAVGAGARALASTLSLAAVWSRASVFFRRFAVVTYFPTRSLTTNSNNWTLWPCAVSHLLAEGCPQHAAQLLCVWSSPPPPVCVSKQLDPSHPSNCPTHSVLHLSDLQDHVFTQITLARFLFSTVCMVACNITINMNQLFLYAFLRVSPD